MCSYVFDSIRCSTSCSPAYHSTQPLFEETKSCCMEIVLAGTQLWMCIQRYMCNLFILHDNEMQTTNYVPIYVLVRYTMKNAARCDTHCELYDSVNLLKFEHVMYCRNASERLSVSVENTFALWICNVYVVHVSVAVIATVWIWQVEDDVGMCVAPCNSVFATACPICTCTC